MKILIYEWIQNLSVYIILMMAVLQLISNEEYRKYFRFFSGILMMLLVLTPVLKLLNMQPTFDELYRSVTYAQELEMLNEYETFLENAANIWEEEE